MFKALKPGEQNTWSHMVTPAPLLVWQLMHSASDKAMTLTRLLLGNVRHQAWQPQPCWAWLNMLSDARHLHNSSGEQRNPTPSNQNAARQASQQSGDTRPVTAFSKASPIQGLKLQLPSSPFASSGRLGAPVPRQVLYRGPGMLMFRFLVRGKVFQLLGVFTGALMLAAVFSSPTTPQTLDVTAAVAVLVGCVVTSYCIWFYSSRYVGELSLLLPEKRVVRFSVLDFWGNRQDVDVPVDKIEPPFRRVR